jgi:hypothetical protein
MNLSILINMYLYLQRHIQLINELLNILSKITHNASYLGLRISNFAVLFPIFDIRISYPRSLTPDPCLLIPDPWFTVYGSWFLVQG